MAGWQHSEWAAQSLLFWCGEGRDTWDYYTKPQQTIQNPDILDIVSVTNRVQNRAHAKIQPRFWPESRHDFFGLLTNRWETLKMKKNQEHMLNKWCMSKIQKMFRYLSHDLDIKYIYLYIYWYIYIYIYIYINIYIYIYIYQYWRSCDKYRNIFWIFDMHHFLSMLSWFVLIFIVFHRFLRRPKRCAPKLYVKSRLNFCVSSVLDPIGDRILIGNTHIRN